MIHESLYCNCPFHAQGFPICPLVCSVISVLKSKAAGGDGIMSLQEFAKEPEWKVILSCSQCNPDHGVYEIMYALSDECDYKLYVSYGNKQLGVSQPIAEWSSATSLKWAGHLANVSTRMLCFKSTMQLPNMHDHLH